MKRTLVLTTLTLSLLLTLGPRAAAQIRRKVINSGPAAPAGKLPPLIRDTAAPIPTQPTIILATVNGTVVNVVNGAATVPQTPMLSGQSVKQFIGMTRAGSKLYGLTSAYAPELLAFRSRLFTITGSNTTLNAGVALIMPSTGICGGAGDLAYDKSGNTLYATCLDSVWKLVTINPVSGGVTEVGPMPVPQGGQSPQYAGLAFSPTGELYALDTMNRRLLMLDKQNPVNNYSVITLTAAGQLPNPSPTGSLGFNDDGGLFASFGNQLIAINSLTGEVAQVGAGTYTGLVVSGGGLVVHN
jgi:hypothetical protein